MNARIKSVKFKKEYESKYGLLYGFEVVYEVDGEEKKGFYSSKKREQTNFVEGKDCELVEEVIKSDKGDWVKIKPSKPFSNSNYGRVLKREQTRYSGFAVSYAKDLVVADKLKLEELDLFATKLFDLMVNLDKSMEG